MYRSVLLLFALIAGCLCCEATTYYKLTQVTSVEADELYVFEQDGYVMNNTVSSNALQTTSIFNTIGLKGTETYVWTLESATGGFYMKNVSLSSNQYLCNSSGSANLSFGSKTAVWAFNFQSDNTVLIQNKTNSDRFLGYGTDTHVYKAYVTDNLASCPHAIKVYKLEEITEPTMVLSTTSLSFGNVPVKETKTMQFTVTTFSLTGDLTIVSDNDKYTVSPTSIAMSTSGSTNISVTACPMLGSDNMNGTITISGGGITPQTVALSATPYNASVTSEGPEGNYQLVTNASTLKDGDRLLIVSEDYSKVMGADKGNNRAAVAVTISNNTITTVPSSAQIITLEGETNKWYFSVGNNQYLYAPSTPGSNYLKTGNKSASYTKATISIDSSTGKATIVFQGSNSTGRTNILRYNNTNSLFSCYSSSTSQTDVCLYRYTEDPTFDISMGSAGYKTLVSARDVSLPEGLEAYIVTENGTEDVKLRKVNNVKANHPYILKGEQGSHTLTIIESADVPTDNLLRISDNETGDGVFVLAKKAQGVGFYKWTGGLLGAGRVYLPASSDAPFLGFEFDEATSMSLTPTLSEGEGVWYDLSGRKLQSKPTAKGIYIMNGKKVVIMLK